MLIYPKNVCHSNPSFLYKDTETGLCLKIDMKMPQKAAFAATNLRRA